VGAYFGPSGLSAFWGLSRGDVLSLRFALAPGFYISRRWRSEKNIESTAGQSPASYRERRSRGVQRQM